MVLHILFSFSHTQIRHSSPQSRLIVDWTLLLRHRIVHWMWSIAEVVEVEVLNVACVLADVVVAA